jgi:hypothetical protein
VLVNACVISKKEDDLVPSQAEGHELQHFAYFLPILRTKSRQRRTSQGKYGQLANPWQKGG